MMIMMIMIMMIMINYADYDDYDDYDVYDYDYDADYYFSILPWDFRELRPCRGLSSSRGRRARRGRRCPGLDGRRWGAPWCP